MTQKIQGKFYPLQHDEWLRACRELTPAQRDVLYYIRTIDPYNQGIDINAAEVARQLSGPGGKVHRQTISRALKELNSKGFIDSELIQVRVKIKAKGLWCDETPQAIATHHSGSSDTTVDHQTPQAIVTHHTESETVTVTESCNSKINKTNSDVKTYSDNTRASCEKFESSQVSQVELAEAEKELRHCRINPDVVRRELLRWFANFDGAIARTKEALAQGWCNNPTAVFVKSIKLGLKPNSPVSQSEGIKIPDAPPLLISWFEANQDKARDIFYSSLNECWRVAFKNSVQLNWWEALGVPQP